MPLNVTDCGEPAAESVATSLAVAAPAAVGLKTIEIVHFAPAASDVLQVLVEIANSLALVPEKVYELTETTAVLVLEIVRTCAAEFAFRLVVGKVRLVGEKAMVGCEAPVPLNETDCGEPAAESVATSLAVAAPAAVGLKTMEIVQLALEANDVPQVLVEIKNSLAFVPEKVYELTVAATELVLVIVSTCAAEVVFRLVVEKVRLVGEKVKVACEAAVPVPLNGTDCGDPAAESVATSLAVAAPATVGLKTIEIVQLALAASAVLQVLLEIENSLALVPENT